jgi:hypothetical protein
VSREDILGFWDVTGEADDICVDPPASEFLQECVAKEVREAGNGSKVLRGLVEVDLRRVENLSGVSQLAARRHSSDVLVREELVAMSMLEKGGNGEPLERRERAAPPE